MEYHVYHPSSELSRYIKCYWTLDGAGDTNACKRERIFPDGCIELIFHYGGLTYEHKNNEMYVQPRSFIHGQLLHHIEITPPQDTGTLGIRFRPEGLQPFIQCSVSALSQQSVAIADIWKNEAAQLEDSIMIATNNLGRIMNVEHFFIKKLKNRTAEDARIAYCVRLIKNSKGSITIEQLSAKANMGRRHLERQFAACVGINPKLFARITRFQHTLQLSEQNIYTSLTSLAHDGGYYDQPHYIRDFKVFTGMTPKSYYDQKPELAHLLLGA